VTRCVSSSTWTASEDERVSSTLEANPARMGPEKGPIGLIPAKSSVACWPFRVVPFCQIGKRNRASQPGAAFLFSRVSVPP
jgi:hypothetical protein